MDLWVRSQDRRALYKTSGFFIKEEQYKRKGKYIIEGNECWLGAYNTFERALEVLDEIQNILKPKYILDSSSIKPDGDSWIENGMILQNYNANAKIEEFSTYVYDMPKE